MKNLDEIKEKYGNRTPFSVPENYFEQFTGKMMAKLPEKKEEKPKKVTLWKRVKPVIYLAAMFSAAAWSINLLTDNHQTDLSSTTQKEISAEPDQDDASASLAMAVDDYALYEYMSEEKAN